jgi:phage/conjugal plasmid C-4 type zinc finger TraR family protein
MDAADFVTADQLRAQQRFEAQRKALAARQVKPSAKDCAECGDEIPQKRREAITGVQLCTGCQQKTE